MPYFPGSNSNAANYNPNDVPQVGIGSALIGKPIPTKSLQDEADRVRSQSDQLKNLLGQLQYVLFEPTPSDANASLEKDNPSTIEGNLQYAVRTLSFATLTLENILAKIGGR